MAKALGISEQEVKEQYTHSEIAERNLFESHDDYIQRELMPKPK